MTLAELSVLPPIAQMRGSDPTLLADELVHIIEWGIKAHPRSQQKRIGPSEMGNPCGRRLAYKLAGANEVNTGGDGWRPTVGTAVHTWLESTFRASNKQLGEIRWLVETRVDVGEVSGDVITGSVDLYDRMTATSVDWKIVGPTTLKDAKRNGPSQQYRTQGHLYGRGWTRRGLPVDNVAVFYLPSNGELRNAEWWSEPYDEAKAIGAITRVNGIKSLTDSLGVIAAAMLPTAPAHCDWCPFYMPASTDLAVACPGHQETATAVA